MVDPKVLRETLGIGAAGLVAAILGGLLLATGSDVGAAMLTIGALVIAFCVAVLAYELLRRRPG